jgi:8-hydroxy-5-deazaflavin:NADPH oxidoreductase
MEAKAKIAVLGGTGKEGAGLALRWANAGHRVVIGSRAGERAARAAAAINARLGAERAEGLSNADAAAAGEIVVLTVPFAAQLATLQEVRSALAGKILIDATVPLVPPQVGRAQLPDGGSAVLAAQKMLGAGVRVVSAFQNVAAELLADLDRAIDCDVLVCGDDRQARAQVIVLAHEAGMRAWHAGPLENSVVAEALTSVLITINRQYKVSHSGIAITGLPADASHV